MSDATAPVSRAPAFLPAGGGLDLSAPSDAELFHRYQAAPGGEIFRALAARHLPLIWSTARCLVNGDAALAEDVAQIVLTDFARKAPRLPPGTVAAGWLHRHTCFTARKLVRTEIRRRARERRASLLNDGSASNSSGTAAIDHTRFSSATAMTSDPESIWQEAAPLLDAALDGLGGRDREAILLRFYQDQDHRAIGSALGCTEEAARKRVARALEKLRRLFRRRGVLLTAALLSQCLSDHATAVAAAVPASVAAALPGMAWRQAVAGGPIAATSVWMMRWRRRALPVASAAALVAGGFWLVRESGWFGGGKPSGFHSAQTAAFPASTAPVANAGPELLFRYSIASIPAKFLAVRLLTWESSAENDAALFKEVRALAKNGGSLEDFDLSGPLGREIRQEKTHTYDHATGWSWDPENDMPKATGMETRDLGTYLSSTARKSDDDALNVVWQMQHYYAEPEFHAWPIALEKSARDPARSIQQEDFHRTDAGGTVGQVRENEPRLLQIQHLSPAVLPDAAGGARTLLVFVTVNPS